MERYVRKIYSVFIVVTVSLILLAGIDTDLNITKRKTLSGYEIIKEYEYAKVTDYMAPKGVREEYSFYPDAALGKDQSLMFYTIHQNVEVYVGEERIYSMRPKHDNFFGKTPGCLWNIVELTADDMGQPVRVLVYPVYKSSIGIVTDFYYGEKFEISRQIVLQDMFAIVLSLIGIVAGVFYIAYIKYNDVNSEMDKSLIMLGCFSIAVSLWNLTDLPSVSLWLPRRAELYLIPLLMLQLVSVPFTLFVKELCSSKENKIWDIPCIASFSVQGLTMSLQLFGLVDLRETLWMTHVVMVLTILITGWMVAREVRKMGWNLKLRRNLIFISICFIGFFIDLVFYYAGKGKYPTVMGMIGFVVYVLASGAFFMRDARELINIGVRARNFERMAYHDQLTGLFNRTAFTNHTTGDDFSAERCIVAAFDLNDLKKCNDALGHEKGDVYIKECADMIKTVFEDAGNCYRMGGDEFCVLLHNMSLDQCKRRMQKLQDLVVERNARYPEIHMGIAYGYEVYDKRIDYDINDTLKRADKMMYREKFAMKEKKA